MTREEWKAAHRLARTMKITNPRRRVSFTHDGRPFRLVNTPGAQIRVLACRIADRPTAQLVARELDDAAHNRRSFAAHAFRRPMVKRAHRADIEAARAWRAPDWRERVRQRAQAQQMTEA